MAAEGIVIAVDGPASSGKGTASKLVATQLGYTYLDSGALYRVVALLGTRRGIAHDEEHALASMIRELDLSMTWEEGRLRVWADGEELSEEIRAESVGQGASAVSRWPAVRDALLDLQRDLGAGGGVVMDGRDIGTVVFPMAHLKVYLDASLDVRARRRTEEMLERGLEASFDQVRNDIEMRDTQDRNRTVAPLMVADDAITVDSTGLTPGQVVARILELARIRGA
ncbi:MAG: (d)CMP kinase [Myxococcota bacterium]|nr:(d)CMP kinase [Myxococcota bacterium]